MQLSFLCTKHADWVYSNPKEALHFLTKDELQGTMLFMDGHFCDAIPYIGCAFDICAILLELEEGENRGLINKVNSLSVLLVSAYEKLGLEEYRQAIIHRTDSITRAVNNVERKQPLFACG